MGKIKISPSVMFIGMIILAVIDQLIMFIGAILIGKDVLAFEAAKVWGIAALLVASLVSGGVCVNRNGIRLNSYLTALLYLIIICFLLPGRDILPVSLNMSLKMVVALFCGTFLGHLFGSALFRKIGNYPQKNHLRRL